MGMNPDDVTFEMLKAAVEDGSVTSLLSNSSADIEQCDDEDFTLLKTAVDNENEDSVDTLIKYGADVNNKGLLDDSLYPIHIACKQGSSRIVESLLDSGADIESRNSSYLSPLYYAVSNQHNNVVQLLVERGADVNALIGWPMRYTVLHSAVKTGNKSIVEFLVRNGADCNSRQMDETAMDLSAINKDGETPLSIAITAGYTDIVLFLIEQGADVNSIVHKRTMLVIACEKGSTEIVENLLDNGANIEHRNRSENLSPLYYAVHFQHSDVIEMLMKRGANVNGLIGWPIPRTVLHVAVKVGNKSIVEFLVRNGADCNAQHISKSDFYSAEYEEDGGDGDTPLSVALLAGHTDVALFLIDKGADVNATVDKCTMLIYALQYCNENKLGVLQSLISHGADVNAKSCTKLGNSFGDVGLSTFTDLVSGEHTDKTRKQLGIIGARYVTDRACFLPIAPLSCACFLGHYAAVELLLDHKAHVNAIISKSVTPLNAAIRGNNVEIVRLLVERGAEVDHHAHESLYVPPLQFSIWVSNNEIIHILLRTKPRPTQSCLVGCAIIAILYREMNVFKLILSEMDKYAINANFPCLLNYAIGCGDIEKMKFLLNLNSDFPVFKLSDEFNKNTNIVFTVARNGQTEILKLFIERGVEIDVKNIDGQTLLIIAAANGRFEMVQMLVVSGADVFAVDMDGNSATYYATHNGNSDLANYLKNYTKQVIDKENTSKHKEQSLFDVVDVREATNLLSKEDVDIENYNGSRPLHLAARRKLVDLVQFFIEFGATIDATDSAGNTPLHEAARQGLDVTKALVMHSKRLNVRNNKGFTPLHEAVQNGHFDVALFLIENGADPKIEDIWMNTPFHYTVFPDLFASPLSCSLFKHVSKSVKPNIAGISLLSRLKCYTSYLNESDKNHIDHITSSCKCTDADILGNTEIHRLVGVYRDTNMVPRCSNIEKVVDVLLEAPEVSLNTTNIFGQTPLHVAHNVSAFKACLKHGGEESFRRTDKFGRNIWHLLACRDDGEHIVKLIEQVVPPCVTTTDLEATDELGRTPFHYAVMYDNDWFVDWLIDKGCQHENVRDFYGNRIFEYSAFISTEMRASSDSGSVNNSWRWFKRAHNKNTFVRHLTCLPFNSISGIFCSEVIFTKTSLIIAGSFDVIMELFSKNSHNMCRLRPIEDEAEFVSNILKESTYKYPSEKVAFISHPKQTSKSEREKDGVSNDNIPRQLFESITELVSAFMFNLLKHVAEMDHRFKGKLVPAGSIYEGTKVDSCDEFDFIVVLECFSELVNVEESPSAPPGYVVLKIADKIQQSTTFAEFFTTDEILNTRLVKFRFEAIMKQVLSKASFQKENEYFRLLDDENLKYSFSADHLATNIRMEFTKPINGQKIFHDVSIDVVPALRKKDYWPADAMPNSNQRIISVFEDVPKECYLVFEQPQKKHPWVGWTSPHARVDFSVLESNIIRTCPSVLCASCVVVKQLVKNFCNFTFLKSYVIKAALMHIIFVDYSAIITFLSLSISNDSDFKSALTYFVQRIMRRLLCFVLQDYVPSVFMPSFVLPVCSFQPHVKFSHIRLNRSGINSYKALINTILMGDSNKLIDSQFEHITRSFIITHLMYWSVLPKADPTRCYFPPINPLYEEDYWSWMQETDIDEFFSEMKAEWARLTTFRSWPKTSAAKPFELAAAGWFYTGLEDEVQCAFCRGKLHTSEVHDVPVLKHKIHFPHCPFVREDDIGNVPLIEWVSSLVEDTDGMRNSADVFDYLKYESVRLKTFRDWPICDVVEPSELAAAGWFYTGLDDRVQCAFCLRTVCIVPTEPETLQLQIKSLHKQYYSHCPFFRGDDVGNVSLTKFKQS